MANPIAYNSGTTVSGCINTGTISLAIDNLNYSTRPGNLNWYAGADPTNRYLIVSDTYSQGVDTQANSKPTIWATSALTDNELLKWINGLPARSGQSTFGTLADAISWLTGQNKYLISNQHYPQIVTSGMVLNLDAGFTSSYPNVGTSWYDLRGGYTASTITNGPTWTNNGPYSYISFDGSNDYVKAPINLNFTEGTISCWVYATQTGRNFFVYTDNNPTNTYTHQLGISSGNKLVAYIYDGNGKSFEGVTTMNTNRWYHCIFWWKDNVGYGSYLNALTQGSGSIGTAWKSGSNFWIGSNSGFPQLNGFLNGNISKVQIYNRMLSQNEILQNFYQGPIVTSGLTFAIDAGNLVSYGGVGTTVYDLTTTGVTGTLTNGPTWTYLSGGTFSFDGTNDYCQATNLPITGNTAFTLSCFTNVQANPTSGSGDGGIMLYGKMGTANQVGGIYYRASDNYVRFTAWGGVGVDYATGFLKDFNVWHNWVLVYNGVNVLIYRDGVADPNGTQARSLNITEGTLTIGAAPQNGSYLQQKIPMTQLYNRALSESEIKQNFEAYRGRFGV